jgi:hypothetical protein
MLRAATASVSFYGAYYNIKKSIWIGLPLKIGRNIYTLVGILFILGPGKC